jgi:zinc transporter ZupT
MLSNVQLALGLALLLGVIDYLSEGHFMRKRGLFKERLVSFAAGLSVSYIFLHLFPQIYLTAHEVPRLIFLAMLTGFVAYHAIEKLIYQYAPRDEVVDDIELEHSVTLFFYHFAIGIVFLSLMRQSQWDGVLFFIPVSLHVIINALPHGHRFQRMSVKAFFSSAPLLGVMMALVVPIPPVVYALLFGVVAGILLFVEAREVVPRRRAESIVWFLIGVVSYGFLIGTSWL